MKKEMMWFFGIMAVVSLISLIVGLNSEVVFNAKLVALFGCLLGGLGVMKDRDREDRTVAPKLFMCAMAGFSILVGNFLVDMIVQDGFRMLGSGVGIYFTAIWVLFVAATVGCVIVYWRDRPSFVTVRTAMATCLVYLLPAVILMPMVIYI